MRLTMKGLSMATLSIGSSESTCLGCGKSASPQDNGHERILGWDMTLNGTPGCGEPWTAVRIDYYPIHYGFIYENLRGLPMEGLRIPEGTTYPPEKE